LHILSKLRAASAYKQNSIAPGFAALTDGVSGMMGVRPSMPLGRFLWFRAT
jgi:hypothetical protein